MEFNCPHCSLPIRLTAYAGHAASGTPHFAGFVCTHGNSSIYCGQCGNIAPPGIFACGYLPTCNKCGRNDWKSKGYSSGLGM